MIKTLCSLTAVAFLLTGCGTPDPPTDSAGKGPDEIMLETYQLILAGNFAEAEKSFSPKFLDEFVVSKGKTFDFYCGEYTKGWKPEWLKTQVMGNDYNQDIWRVKIIPDEGKGAENRPGIVQDLILVEGAWQIVFWGHYPKS